MWVFDAHLDLAMNAVEWNRDLTRPLSEIRAAEAALDDKLDRGRGLVSLPEMAAGGVGMCVATLIARCSAADCPVPGWNSPEIAWAITQGHLAWYRAMEVRGLMWQVVDGKSLDHAVAECEQNSRQTPLYYVLSLEGADSLRTPHDLHAAWEQGLRALGLSHYGPGRYAGGTQTTDGLSSLGRELLREMEQLGLILDVHALDRRWFHRGAFALQRPRLGQPPQRPSVSPRSTTIER